MLTTAVKKRILPLSLTLIAFCCLAVVLYLFSKLLNAFPVKEKIQLVARPLDILVGITIYLKTSIDFALFMGNLMASNPGWKKRIAIEIGTALGNAFGTMIVLAIWFFFKEAPVLMIMMILFSSLVLFEMAEEGLEETLHEKRFTIIKKILFPVYQILDKMNTFFRPVLSKILPELNNTTKPLPFMRLLIFSLSVPFILGLDDFAGYIPLFSIINVFSFIIGVFFAHMLLNIGLFAFPRITIKITRHPLLIILGSLVFIGLALFGLWDILQIIRELFFPH